MRVRVRDGSLKMSTLGPDWQHIGVDMGMGMGTGNLVLVWLYELGIWIKGK